jgi:hypothetical protein
MRRFLFAACSTLALTSVVVFTACGSDTNDTPTGSSSGDGDGGCTGFGCSNNEGGKPGCVGLECNQVTCDNGGQTTLSGVVLDPAGKVPIYNAIVYVANADPAAIPTGASCDRCDAKVSGVLSGAITQTDVEGKFQIQNVPVVGDGKTIPLAVQIGKWRRVVQVTSPAACTDLSVDTGDGAGKFRLPKNRTEGNIPRIAIATGAADPIQCLFRKIGLEDGEFGVKGSESRVHLYQGGGDGTNNASSAVGATPMTNVEALWSSLDDLKTYDLVVLGCEGLENDTDQHKPAAAKQALYDYAKAGGRVFTSHFHFTFFSTSTAPTDTQTLGTWRPAPESTLPPAYPSNPHTTPVNASFPATPFPKAQAMKDWLTKQNALNGDGTLPILDARHNLDAVVDGKALSWLTVTNPNAGGATAVQYMTFNAPVGAPDDQICGRVVFSDLHVGQSKDSDNVTGPDDPTVAFPGGCVTKELSAQQKALEFMLFDLSSCVQKDDNPVQIPK